ncbi:hypothetical protein A3K73_05465 [Candidatus Pacearchaeota archaeon RBG_13_36_9]|nr:MAG: hypothetical protein A3K73_05465 [Candidatus Pacearchaeota archaeon RBG_13_36_9]
MVYFNFFQLSIFFLEAALLFFLFFLFFNIISQIAGADVGENVTIKSELEIGNVAPIIQNIDIEGGTINLNPNTTKLVNCSALVVDYNGDSTIQNVSARLFDNSFTYASPDDNNSHYTNNNCSLDISYGDENTVLASCLFNVWYYANAGTWNCSVFVLDLSNISVSESNTTQVLPLLALSVPSFIDYGVVNATEVSNENITNVTNVGNVMFNLSLTGYSYSLNDNLAMNCTLGAIKNISVEHEKYNLTLSNNSVLTLAQADATYTNLSSTTAVGKFNLDYRTNDTIQDAINATYWRIYVPLGVAGSCQGNIIFGAVQSGAS